MVECTDPLLVDRTVRGEKAREEETPVADGPAPLELVIGLGGLKGGRLLGRGAKTETCSR